MAAWPEGTDLGADARASATIDGKLMGVPWYVGVRALYYRSDVFTELGPDAPGRPRSHPDRLTELAAMTAALTTRSRIRDGMPCERLQT